MESNQRAELLKVRLALHMIRKALDHKTNKQVIIYLAQELSTDEFQALVNLAACAEYIREKIDL